MLVIPEVNVGTTPYVFAPASGHSKLVYLRVNVLTGGSTVYMGPTPGVTTLIDITHVTLAAGVSRLKWTDYELLQNSGTDPNAFVGNEITAGWIITGGSDAGVTVQRVEGDVLVFSAPLGSYADDSITLAPPFAADPIYGFPLLSPSVNEFTDERFLSKSLSFATGSGSASVSIAFALS